jgi:hypothetical protein
MATTLDLGSTLGCECDNGRASSTGRTLRFLCVRVQALGSTLAVLAGSGRFGAVGLTADHDHSPERAAHEARARARVGTAVC